MKALLRRTLSGSFRSAFRLQASTLAGPLTRARTTESRLRLWHRSSLALQRDRTTSFHVSVTLATNSTSDLLTHDFLSSPLIPKLCRISNSVPRSRRTMEIDNLSVIGSVDLTLPIMVFRAHARSLVLGCTTFPHPLIYFKCECGAPVAADVYLGSLVVAGRYGLSWR